MTFATLKEYLLDARRIIVNQGHGFLLKDEDAVADVAHRIMLADATWDGRSSKTTWRYNQAKYAILKIMTKRKKAKKILSIDRDFGQKSSLHNILPDNKTYFSDNIYHSLCEQAEKVLNGRQLECFKMYYVDGLTMEDIGKKIGCTKQNASLHINKGIKKLKQCMLKQDS